MAQKKKEQLREFLRNRLDLGETNGLVWTNKEEHIFRLPWKHQNDSDWDDDDAKLFREWGNHKGREPSKDADLKATFRSALKKTRYVQVVQEDENIRYKICQLIYPDEDANKRVSALPRSDAHQDREMTEVPRLPTMPSGAESNLPTTLQEITATPPSSLESNTSSLKSELGKYIKGEKEIMLDPDAIENLFQFILEPPDMDMSGVEEYRAFPLGAGNDVCAHQSPEAQALLPNVADIQSEQAPPAYQPKVLLQPSEMPSDFSTGYYSKIDFSRMQGPNGEFKLDFSDICVIIKHRRDILNKCHIGSSRGFRISYLKPNEPDLYEELGAKVVAPTLPGFIEGEDVYMTRARGLLEAMSNGLYLYADPQGNIHAVRMSKLRIFYANTIIKGIYAKPEKLPKNEDVVVFDHEMFEQAFEKWLKSEGQLPCPGVRVLFSFGETWDISSSLDKCHISAVIASTRLLFRMQNYTMMMQQSSTSKMEVSNSSSWNSPPSSAVAVQQVSSGIEGMSF